MCSGFKRHLNQLSNQFTHLREMKPYQTFLRVVFMHIWRHVLKGWKHYTARLGKANQQLGWIRCVPDGTGRPHAGAAWWALWRRPSNTTTSPTAQEHNGWMNQSGCWKLEWRLRSQPAACSHPGSFWVQVESMKEETHTHRCECEEQRQKPHPHGRKLPFNQVLDSQCCPS